MLVGACWISLRRQSWVFPQLLSGAMWPLRGHFHGIFFGQYLDHFWVCPAGNFQLKTGSKSGPFLRCSWRLPGAVLRPPGPSWSSLGRPNVLKTLWNWVQMHVCNNKSFQHVTSFGTLSKASLAQFWTPKRPLPKRVTILMIFGSIFKQFWAPSWHQYRRQNHPKMQPNFDWKWSLLWIAQESPKTRMSAAI